MKKVKRNHYDPRGTQYFGSRAQRYFHKKEAKGTPDTLETLSEEYGVSKKDKADRIAIIQ